jgi:hypothetical protein
VTLTAKQEELCTQSRWDFSDLRALFINCTLKRSPEPSNTQGLADIAIEIGSRESPGVGRLRTRLANAQHQYHRRAGEQAREHGLIPKTVFA